MLFDVSNTPGPPWLFKTANIDHAVLSSIKKELLNAFLKIANKNDRQKTLHFYNGLLPADRIENQNFQIVKNTCPILMQELKRLKLDELLSAVVIISMPADAPEMPIHRDYTAISPSDVHFGLNIPLIGCENSYTVFYNTNLTPDVPIPEHVIGAPDIRYVVQADEKCAVEIARLDSTIPSWVNNFVPHNVIKPDNVYRVNSSLRFANMQPLIDSGYFDQELIK
jgi:hypothetical protein